MHELIDGYSHGALMNTVCRVVIHSQSSLMWLVIKWFCDFIGITTLHLNLLCLVGIYMCTQQQIILC